jgi:cobalt/nickel transport system permease protein
MHIPDGFLDTKTWATLDVVSAATLAYGISRLNRKIEERQIPLMGVSAAFVFAAQMLNFPIAAGTSGHFMGGALVAILLGPWAGMLVMATVLIVQCLLFQDGGLLALGANIFNMGIVGTLVGGYLYRLVKKLGGETKGLWAGAFLAAWFSIVVSASLCAVELAFSGTVPLKAALPAMAGIHALIGIFEGFITVSVVGVLQKVRPDLLSLEKI